MTHTSIQAIDVHAHYGSYAREHMSELVNGLMSADAEQVAERAAMANIKWTIVSPLKALMPRGGGDAIAGNLEAHQVVNGSQGLLQYVVIDPRKRESFVQADEMLRQPKCVGIKIHPEEHCYPIREFGRPIFEFAAARRAVVLTHSSELNSLAADFVPFANSYPEVRLVLAHIGCSPDGDVTHQVRAIQQSKHGNIYADTSSASSITPQLIEWAVSEVGVDRVLFGTDSPLYHTGMQRARIDGATLCYEEKRRILWTNAVELFDLEGRKLK